MAYQLWNEVFFADNDNKKRIYLLEMVESDF